MMPTRQGLLGYYARSLLYLASFLAVGFVAPAQIEAARADERSYAMLVETLLSVLAYSRFLVIVTFLAGRARTIGAKTWAVVSACLGAGGPTLMRFVSEVALGFETSFLAAVIAVVLVLSLVDLVVVGVVCSYFARKTQ